MKLEIVNILLLGSVMIVVDGSVEIMVDRLAHLLTCGLMNVCDVLRDDSSHLNFFETYQ